MGYTAFGTSYSPRTTIEIDQRYTYTGREQTTDPTLMYYRWRMYAPTLGRFTARDQLEDTQLYLYVNSNPINRNDPSGFVSGKYKVCGPVDDDSIPHAGRTTHSFSASCFCKCDAVSGKYKMNCAANGKTTIKLWSKNNPKWDTFKPSKKSTHIPENYQPLSTAKKRESILDHEREHVKDMQAAYAAIKNFLAAKEGISFDSISDCVPAAVAAAIIAEKTFIAAAKGSKAAHH